MGTSRATSPNLAHPPCPACGRHFPPHDDEAPAHYRDRQFCSRACVYNDMRGKKHEARVRDTWPPRLPENEDFGAGFGRHNTVAARDGGAVKLNRPTSQWASLTGCSAAWAVRGGE